MELINPAFIREFIKVVKVHSCLYDSKHPDYRNQGKKLVIWKEIEAKMNIPAQRCKSKWKALRDQYVREMKRLHASGGNSNAGRWKYFDSLTFLNRSLCPLRTPYKRSPVQNNTENEETQLTEFYTGFSDELTNDKEMLENSSDLKETISIPTQYHQTAPDNINVEFVDETTTDHNKGDPLTYKDVKTTDELIESNNPEEVQHLQEPEQEQPQQQSRCSKTSRSMTKMKKENEVDAFFRSVAMKIKNANFPAVDFIDLQIQILQVISNKLHGTARENQTTSTNYEY